MFYLYRFENLKVHEIVWQAAVVAVCIAALGGCDSRATSKSDVKTARLAVHGKTLGFVLSASYVTPRYQNDKLECPQGFRSSNRQNWDAQFPTQAARKRHMARCHNAQ